ncbi:MAG: MBOAT family protein [Oscillospiraceae bacterium]|nr:MBOAT family protein [Oscillospiraceae bacterium]MBQ7130609.1 MBOAT family protein [Oscillospiraceae bacterium]
MMITILTFLAGLVIYAGYGIPGLLFLLCMTAVSYLCALVTPQHRWFLWISVVSTGFFLIAFKLLPLTGLEFMAPMGVSYFALRILSYNIDIYRGKYEPEENPLKYGLYVTYLPSIFLGPIDRYDSFCTAFYEKRKITWNNLSFGGARILWGLFKKYAIAARAGVLVGTISGDTDAYRGGFALLAVVLYSIQLYADFSGGIDIILGVSRMLGARLSENFNAPYFSQSVQEFWRRWHMTLGSWLKDYIYIPLGGNRKGKVRKVINNLLTFLVSGFWHGVHYLLWGLFNGIFVAVGEKLKTPVKLINQAGTFLVISLLWAFFVWPETLTALSMIGSIFTTFNYEEVFSSMLSLGLNGGEWIVFLVSVLLLWLYDWKQKNLRRAFRKMAPWARVAVMCCLALAVLVFGMYGIGFNAEEFIYSRF